MSVNAIELKKIGELVSFHFFIPSYQRGYRWTKQQVEDLLNDIDAFSPKEVKGTDEETWYCLQPIVVKPRGDEWEVIDGQQRLTTIYLILYCLNSRYVESERNPLFSLQYETRPDSARYLQTKLGELQADISNIDYYYISQAYHAIKEWFGSKGTGFNRNKFESKFNHATKVIWYESHSGDAIDIFTRINMGKIPLTEAELIKALFLNSSNFAIKEEEELRLKQLEIATEWDKIEYTLQDDAFWYFINEGENKLATRIEFIFRLMHDLDRDQTQDEHDENIIFRFFYEKLKDHTEKQIHDNWQAIKQFFQTIEEWYLDRELYHKIGFLITTGTSLKTIFDLKTDLSKSAFKKALDKEIGGKIEAPENLTYHDSRVRNVLLLHNIQTLLNNEEETNRFPFDRFKKENWDVEHISAIAEKMPAQETHRKDWLAEAVTYVKDPVLKERMLQYDRKDNFESLFLAVLAEFKDQEEQDQTHDICNLTLLDAGTNRGYKDAVFPVKRAFLIDREKEGTFIPISTRNVFMKYYSRQVGQMTFWGKEDKAAYKADLAATLSIYYAQ